MTPTLRALLGICSIALLTACAQQPVSNSDAVRNDSKTTSATGSTTATASATATAKQQASALPATIEFAANKTKLDQAGLDAVAAVAKQIPAASKVLVTGYADKKAGNTKNRALARGVAVKAALVKNGIAAKSIRVKYVTTEPQNQAVISIAE